jgi:hypothetical protein
MLDFEYWVSLESESNYHVINSISLQIKSIRVFQMGVKTHTATLIGNKC